MISLYYILFYKSNKALYIEVSEMGSCLKSAGVSYMSDWNERW